MPAISFDDISLNVWQPFDKRIYYDGEDHVHWEDQDRCIGKGGGLSN